MSSEESPRDGGHFMSRMASPGTTTTEAATLVTLTQVEEMVPALLPSRVIMR